MHRACHPLALRVLSLLLGLALSPPGGQMVIAGGQEPDGVARPTIAVRPLTRRPDLDQLVREARRVQERDTESWRHFRFQRQVTREKLSPEGEVTSREELVFRITPTDSGFDEELILMDGRPPTDREVEKHREAARFTERYNATQEGDAGGKAEPLSLQTLLGRSTYSYGGTAVVDGVRCHRLNFEPDEGANGKGVMGRVATALAGSLWISEEGHHVVRAESHTAAPVSVALGLASVQDVRMTFESAPVTAGIWLPTRIEVRSTVRVLWRTTLKRNRFDYGDYRRFDAAPPVR